MHTGRTAGWPLRCRLLAARALGRGRRGEATRTHHAPRRRGARVAARGAGPAARPHAAHRHHDERHRERPGARGPRCGVPAGDAATGLGRRPQRANRRAVGGRQCRGIPALCTGARRAGARPDPRGCRSKRGRDPGGEPLRADRVHAGDRSGRRRHRREPVAARRQCHRLHAVRIQPERQVAGAAQGDRATRHPRRGPARFRAIPPASGSGPSCRRWRRRSEWR